MNVDRGRELSNRWLEKLDNRRGLEITRNLIVILYHYTAQKVGVFRRKERTSSVKRPEVFGVLISLLKYTRFP